ncbi:helix-turn-helix transcriptional regulator [Variovorax rhizosphaerae]|uniref:Helix-turn-helix transcriptional regulator n=1 Tax=Variovorax rhizosphaerae TaxID=1836200 RepID=A0ABU8WIA0_9BURK
MMTATTDLALHRAVEAAHHLTDPEPPWPDILDGVRQVLGGDSASFIMLDGTGALLTLEQVHVDPLAELEYASHYHAQDIVTPATIGAGEGTWFDTQELFSPSTLSRNGYYVDFMCRHRMRQMLTYIVEENPQRRGGLTVQRSEPHDHARWQFESTPIRKLAGTMQEAVLRRREMANHWYDSAESGFCAFDEALCMVNSNGAMLRMSPKAQGWLGDGTALRVRGGRLWHPAEAFRARLLDALERVVAHGTPERLTVPAHQKSDGLLLDLAPADARLRLGRESSVLVRMLRLA